MWSEIQASRDVSLEVLSIAAVTSTCVWLVTSIAVAACRRMSAATRHRFWGLSMLAATAAPILVPAIPIPRWDAFDHLSPPKTDRLAKEMRDVVERPSGQGFESDRAAGFTIAAGFGSIFTPRTIVETSDDQTTQESDFSMNPVVDNVPVDVAGPTSRRFPRIGVLQMLRWVWITGMIVSFALLMVSRRSVTNWINRAIRINSGPEVTRCTQLCHEFMIQRPVRIVVSTETLVPFVSGIWKPVVVLPAGFGKWTSERLRVVLAHELMHVQRNDVFWQIASRACLIVNWFNPLGWMVARQLRVECEYACDDAVVLSGTNASEYATHLLEIAQWIQTNSKAKPCVVAMASNSHVEKRIRSLLDPSVSRHPANRRWTSIAVCVMAMAIIFIAAIAPLRSESKPLDSTVADEVFAAERDRNRRPAEVQAKNDGRKETSITSLVTDSSDPHSETRLRFMIPSVQRVQDDLQWLIELSPTAELRKQSVALRQDLIAAFTQGIDMTKPIVMDLIVRDQEISTEYRFPISTLKGNNGFLAGLQGIGYKVKTIVDGTSYEVSERNKKPFYLRVDKTFAWIAETPFPADLPRTDEELRPLLGLDQDFVLNLENDLAGIPTRQEGFHAVRDYLQSNLKRQRNEDANSFELRKSTFQGVLDEAERLIVHASQLRVGWSTSTDGETQFGRGEFLLTALPETELQKHIQMFGTTVSNFANVKRHARPIGRIDLNLPIDPMRIAACARYFELLRTSAESQIRSQHDLTDAQREASIQVTHKSLALVEAGMKMGRMDAFFDLFSLAEQKNALVCGIRIPNEKAIDDILQLLPRMNSQWQIQANLLEYHGVNIHEVTVPNDVLGSFQSAFGDKSVFYVGSGKDTIWVAAGVVALKHLKTAIDDAALPLPKTIDPVAIRYQVDLRPLTSLLKAIHEKNELWPVPQARKQHLETQRYLKLMQDSMDDRNSTMSGELRRTGNRIEGFLEFNENGLRPIGTTIADGLKSLAE